MPNATDPPWTATPALGLRLGEDSSAPGAVQVGFDVPPGPIGFIAQLPVRRIAQGPFRPYRAQDPTDDAPPRAADVGPVIGLDRAQSPLRVGRGRWDGEACEGVLFLLVDDPGRPGPDADDAVAADPGRVAEALAEALGACGPEDLAEALLPRAAVAAAPGPMTARRGAESAPAAADSLCFALGSCQYTVGLIDGTPLGGNLEPGPADKSYARLAKRLRDGIEPQPRYLVLCGDQVYVDATAGLFDPASADDRYRTPYERFYASRAVSDVRRRLPWCMLLDDHEIDDNFARETSRTGQPDWRNQQRLKLGLEAYWRHQRAVGPLPTPAPAGPPPVVDCEVDLGGFDFFFADTRTEREARTAANLPASHIMSARQHDRLRRWLAAGKGSERPRFVVSPSAFLPRRLATSECAAAALHSDAWDGYPASMAAVLECIADADIRNVVFLSGDLHRCCVATATLARSGAQPLRLHSIHSSGLYAPYPFANASACDYAEVDTLAAGGRSWRIEAEFLPAADGFCVVHVHRICGRGWRIEAEFDLLGAARTVTLDLG